MLCQPIDQVGISGLVALDVLEMDATEHWSAWTQHSNGIVMQLHKELLHESSSGGVRLTAGWTVLAKRRPGIEHRRRLVYMYR